MLLSLFQSERSDDRKYVCRSQAKFSHALSISGNLEGVSNFLNFFLSAGQVNASCKGLIESVNPLSPNTVQDQFSPYNYPYTVKR